MNEFNFHNVGQGLFYSGKLLDGRFNFVYDCGSISHHKYLNNAIDTQLTTQLIDFIVISHLDKDHINGLERIVKTRDVKKIYLPYLGYGNLNLVKLLVAYSFLTSRSNNDNLFDNQLSIDELIQNYQFIVDLYNEDKRNQFNFEITFLGVNAEQIGESPFSYSLEHFNCYDESAKAIWKFIMFNKRISDTTLSALENQIRTLMKLHAVSDIVDLVKLGNLVKIQSIYTTIFAGGKKSLNETSTILMHWPLYNTHIISGHYFYNDKAFYPNHYPCTPISILTGDAKFDAVMLLQMDKVLKIFTDAYTVFQVPHHGSKTNWNSLTHRYKFVFNHYVIPFGLGRKSHPHPIVIKELSTLKTSAISLNTEIGIIRYYIN